MVELNTEERLNALLSLRPEDYLPGKLAGESLSEAFRRIEKIPAFQKAIAIAQRKFQQARLGR